LNAAGNATANTVVVAQQGNTTAIPKLAGLAAFVQTQSSAARSFLTSTVTITIYMVFIYLRCEWNI
jgi:hypothetical protein